MPGWQEGSGFRIVGFVVRKFTASSGKFGRLTVDVNQSPHPAKLDLRTFDPSLVADVGQLQAGQKVQIRGRIEVEKLKNKAKEEIKIDGYAHWSTVLTLTALEVEGNGRAAATQGIESTPDAAVAGNPFDAPAIPSPGESPFGGEDNPFGE